MKKFSKLNESVKVNLDEVNSIFRLVFVLWLVESCYQTHSMNWL